MWNEKMKALTFSYDDGVDTDKRLCEIFDKYGMKCTWNLNGSRLFPAAKLGAPWRVKSRLIDHEAAINRLPLEEMREIYKNHEIAAHGYTHPKLAELSREVCTYEILADLARLRDLFGDMPVGLAYPNGSYDDMVVDVLAECGVKYARTVKSTFSFDMQTDLLRFRPTCHHKDACLMELAEKFVSMTPDTPQLFYVWGHSYEFAADDNWELIERFCEYMAGRDDIYYCTNTEALL